MANEIPSIQEARAKRFLSELVRKAHGVHVLFQQITMEPQPPDEEGYIPYTLSLPHDVILNADERLQLKKGIEAALVWVTDQHARQEHAPVRFTLSTPPDSPNAIERMAANYLKRQGPQKADKKGPMSI